MPTPMSAYYEAAKRFGGIDPNDQDAVRKFFREDFHQLSPLKKKTIMSFLMAREGASEQSDNIATAAPAELKVKIRFFVRLENSFGPVAPAHELLANMKSKSA